MQGPVQLVRVWMDMLKFLEASQGIQEEPEGYTEEEWEKLLGDVLTEDSEDKRSPEEDPEGRVTPGDEEAPQDHTDI